MNTQLRALSEVDCDRKLQDAFVAALQKPQSRSTPALLDFLPQLRRIYVALSLTPSQDPAPVVHEQLNVYVRTATHYQNATGSQLLHECRILRRILPDALSAAGLRANEHLMLVHSLVDACISYWMDAFVHEEELLRSSRAQFSETIDAIPQLVWRTTPDGEATFANRRFRDHVGRTLDELLGWGWLGTIHPEDAPLVAQEWSRCRSLDIPVEVTFRVRARDGSYRWFLSLGNPIRDDSNTVVAYYGTWTDVDGHKRLQEQLLKAVRARDEFLCVASHELKTPLTAMQLQVQMRSRSIHKKGRTSLAADEVLSMLASDRGQLQRIGRLVDDMLDISRLDTGKLTLSKDEICLEALLQDLVQRQRSLFDAAGCNVTLDCDGPVMGKWDGFRIEQAINNLLLNGCRYAPGSPIEITLCQNDRIARITVTDHGPGIDPADHQRVFERFERAISASERSGLGLGLYIVKQIIEMHHGTVGLRSQKGQGCSFIIELPVSDDAGQPASPGTGSPPPAL